MKPRVDTLAAVTSAQQADPRVGLKPGEKDAGEAAWNLELVSHMPMAPGFVEPTGPGGLNFANSDLAFTGNYAIQGNYNGPVIWDITNPAAPVLVTRAAS